MTGIGGGAKGLRSISEITSADNTSASLSSQGIAEHDVKIINEIKHILFIITPVRAFEYFACCYM